MGVSIRTKRVYEDAQTGDGTRILVDRLWPRGVSKQRAAVAYWAKDLAPSDELRKWYGHDHAKWPEFRARYYAELDRNPAALDALRRHMNTDTVTLVYSSRESELNNATALKTYLESRAAGSRR